MRRLVFLIAILLAGGLLSASCVDSYPVPHPTGAECDGQTVQDAAGCEGGVCLVPLPNKQNVPGICSTFCNVDEDCTEREVCVFTHQGAVCMRTCVGDDDCFDATVCRPIANQPQHLLCFVDPF